jgi:hypothetical protein
MLWYYNHVISVSVEVRSFLFPVWIMCTDICLGLCDTKRSLTANMLALLILYN